MEDKIKELENEQKELDDKKIKLGKEIIQEMNKLLRCMDTLGLHIFNEDNEELAVCDFWYSENEKTFYCSESSLNN